MAKIRTREQMPVRRHGPGWTEILLADPQTGAGLPMRASRWVVQPHSRTPEIVCEDDETILYVVRGSGTAVIGGMRHRLEAETVLWVEPGDPYQLESGKDGLEILQGSVAGEP